MASKELVVERPSEPEERFPWDDGIKKRFHFDSGEIESLEACEIVWRGETAFSVEDAL